MPRAKFPNRIREPKPKSFILDGRARKNLARCLGHNDLPTVPNAAEAICLVISRYKATEGGAKSTTIANIKVTLRNLEKKGQTYNDAIEVLADDCSGVDYITHGALQNLAKDVLAGKPDAKEKLLCAASVRLKRIEDHERVDTLTEPLRLFCGWLRVIFENFAAPHKKKPRDLRKFAKQVFITAEIETADFDAHSDRLNEYLGTDVSWV